MELDPVFLSRLQFGFVISFHIVFPSFTIGLAAWLAMIEGVRLATGRQVYRRVFDFWLKICALSFAMGVVSGIVMAFQFGTNWSELSERTGSIQGPLWGYEAFTAFMLEATFFGVVLLGRNVCDDGSILHRGLSGACRVVPWPQGRADWPLPIFLDGDEQPTETN
jgi:cytochrome d ubiquinol oxidase subunit I